MTLSTVTAANKAQVWDSDFFAQYVRANRFKRFMGTDENAIIQLKEELTKKAGDKINIPLIAKLTGAGVTGNTALEGAEEALGTYNHPITVATLRHGVAVTDNEQQYTEIGLRDAAKVMLKLWAGEKMRDAIIAALGTKSGIAYGTATEVEKDAWLVANSDRVLFGTGVGAFTDHSADLLLVTNAMTLSKAIVSKAKGKAETASPIVRPVTVTEDEETYVLFCGSGAFRDLKTDLGSVLENAAVRGKENPLFRDGDLMYDGVVIRKIPEIAAIGTVGAASARVEPYYLCGAQALGIGWAQRTKSTTDVRDYGFVKGCGIHEMRGIEKLIFNGKDHGVFTGYVGALAI